MQVKLTKDELLDALKAQRKLAVEADKGELRVHRRAKREWLAATRIELRRLARLSYKELKDELQWGGKVPLDSHPPARSLVHGSTTGPFGVSK